METRPSTSTNLAPFRTTIILPVKLSDPQLDLIRLFEINLTSVDLFMTKVKIEEILIIASGEDLEKIADSKHQLLDKLPIELLAEEEICPFLKYPIDTSNGKGWQGWRVQQVLKMEAAKRVTTETYLILDDDIVATRELDSSDFFRSGRLAMTPISPRHDAHPKWLESSRNILKMPIEEQSKGALVMNVTPQLIVTSEMNNLLAHVAQQWRIDDPSKWLLNISNVHFQPTRSPMANKALKRIENLFSKRLGEQATNRMANWTEYTLYWTFLQMNGVEWKYYDPDPPHLSDTGIWTNSQANELDLDIWIAKTFEQKHKHAFAVFSSKITSTDRSMLCKKLIRWLDTRGSKN